ncbi:MAG TPA: MFS transporter [Bacteroidia bacterium]|nr:MFS transporter [Bacteroidia bacterium]
MSGLINIASMILALYRNAFRNLQRNAWILSISMFINRSGSMVLLFTSLYLTNELNYSISDAGIIMSFYGIGSVLGSYTGGWLTDRRNYFDIMIFSLVTSGLILLLMLVATSMIFLCAVIFLYAYAADMFRPANSAAIAAYSTPENRTRSVSLARLAINLGFSVGPAAGGFIAHYLGYKWLFVIDAFTSFGAALMLYIYLPKEKYVASPHKDAVLGDSRTSAYRDVRYLFFILLVALYGTCFFQLFASVPQYFSKVSHYTEDVIGLLLALNGLLVVVIEMPLIASLEKRKKIFPFIIAGALSLPLAFGILKVGGGLMLWAIVYTIVITISEIFAMPFMMNYSLTRPRKERQGQYSALYSIAFGLAIIAAPSLGLGIADKYGFDTLFIFLISLGFVVALGFAALSRKENTI